MGKRIFTVILLILLSSACAETKLFVTNVGKGDALFLMRDGYTAMIDTGKEKAKDDILRAMEALSIKKIDDLFITHGDKDHTGGMKWLDESDIEIGEIYTSKYADVDDVLRLSVGEAIEAGGGTLTVLAPEQEYPDEDNNSLVMRYECSDGTILLTGDMEQDEENELLHSNADLKCDVLKVPNHGDGDACGEGLVAACMPQVAVISTSSKEKTDTPDLEVMARLGAVCGVYVTQDSDMGILIVLKDGEVSVSVQ